MAEGPGDGLIPAERAARSLRQLAASRRELVDAVARQIAFAVEHLKQSPDEARARHLEPPSYDVEAEPADQVSWYRLSHLVEQDAERGHALWDRLKREAAEELATGWRTARSLERGTGGQPLDRARFGVLIDGLTKALAPRGALEALLVHQLAAAYDRHLAWQAEATRRLEAEAWHGDRDRRRELERMSPAQRERYEAYEGWVPPRLSDAEAVEQAVTIADRYQRSFLRLMKAFRDNRRLFGALVVAGGQVNIGEQQVNVQREPPRRPARVRTAPVRRTAPAKVRNTTRRA